MSIAYYHELLADQTRIRAFQAAIRGAVGPDDVVLEIGTGLGTFALFAAAVGARHVWAVEGEPVIHVARALSRLNGHHDRITWVRGWVPDVEIPEQADVLIYEDFVTPLFDVRIYRMLRQAIARYLAPGGRMIPSGASVFVAPLSSVALRTKLFPLESVKDRFGLEWSPAEAYLGHLPRQDRVSPDMVVGDASVVYEVTFPRLPSLEEMEGTASWTVSRETDVHALALWFDLEPGPGLEVTNRPGDDAGPWGQLVLPLDPPLRVEAGGALTATVGYDPAPDGAPGWLRWEARSGAEVRRGHEFASSPAGLEDFDVQPETSPVAPQRTLDVENV
ncbi:MAG: class I SAM-dependent methyltransferase [Gemmatimonadota bacterium]|nr:class I SAM-dependent methyltransferase [Gemmatimonadota bacterium]